MYILMAKAQDSQIVIDLMYDYKSPIYPNLTCIYFSHSIFFPFTISRLTVELATHFSNNDYFSSFHPATSWPFITSSSSADQEHSGTIFLHFIAA